MSQNKKTEDLPIFIKWIEFVEWLLPITAKFPQRTRFTFANRIDNYALDMVSDLVEARYTKDRYSVLKRAKLRLEKLRVLFRLSKNMQLISYKSYDFNEKPSFDFEKISAKRKNNLLKVK
jgi:hypothetical protein